jgi:hypothetical protein
METGCLHLQLRLCIFDYAAYICKNSCGRVGSQSQNPDHLDKKTIDRTFCLRRQNPYVWARYDMTILNEKRIERSVRRIRPAKGGA